MLASLNRTIVGPVFHEELVSCEQNFDALRSFAHSLHTKRRQFEEGGPDVPTPPTSLGVALPRRSDVRSAALRDEINIILIFELELVKLRDSPSASAAPLPPATVGAPAAVGYANALKGQPPRPVQPQGPSVIFYPEAGSEAKTMLLEHQELKLVKLRGSPSAFAPQLPATVGEPPAAADALKMGQPPPPVQLHGPSVIFYPEAGSDARTSDDSKKILQNAVKPAQVGIKVTQVRRVGNSGVVVRTASEESAQKLRDAAPPGLRVAVPKPKMPRVALRYLSAELSGKQIIQELYRINLADDADWPLSRFREECVRRLETTRTEVLSHLRVLPSSAG
ncbi:uncharacterized protein LOC134751228 [Cydia strobilella]|uniref:uncharacterized protein LOC134751228 n=1 Tax=Cydia strobilella TaxID=1100964 RepID=UPI003003BFDC